MCLRQIAFPYLPIHKPLLAQKASNRNLILSGIAKDVFALPKLDNLSVNAVYDISYCCLNHLELKGSISPFPTPGSHAK